MKAANAALFLAAAALPAFAQKPGDAVITPDTLGKIEWIKGSAPTAWEPGKVYVLDCWATWSEPSVAAIPHVDELYDKYQEKGLRVIGVNVWEDGKDKVADFVKTKGDGMSYPVAYTGKGGAFETEWLKTAKVANVPHAFVVKDGKVLLSMPSTQLNDVLIENLLAGGEAQSKVLDGIKEDQRKRAGASKAIYEFRMASMEKKKPAMETAFAELKKLDPENSTLPVLEFDLFMAKGDWAAAESALVKLSMEPVATTLLTSTAQKLGQMPEAPESFRRAVATHLSKQLEKSAPPAPLQILAKVQWSLGDKDAAKASAKRALEAAKSSEANKVPTAPFEKFAEALEKGELPSDQQMTTWLREASPQPVPGGSLVPKPKEE